VREGRRPRQAGPDGAAAPAEALGPDPEEEFAARHVQPYVEAEDLERVARGVVGVYSVRVLRRADEPVPYRVRVVAQGSRRTAVAKDIQSAWFALWSLYVPRRAFAVTAVRSPLDLGPDRRRLQLCHLSCVRAAAEVAVTVALFSGGRIVEGRAAAARAGADLRRLAALATLDAVRPALAGPLPELVELRAVRVGGVPALVCALARPRGMLLGVCEVRGDEQEAAARAVLDAVNRLLEPDRTVAARLLRPQTE
jgi:hypothetical protein